MGANDIKLPPDPARVMAGLRDTGYDFNTAVADIIDNSIAANASNVRIILDTDAAGMVYVYIADDGCGMNFEELKNAMKYGSAERMDRASLGKFGLGLKTASTAFCRCLSVISRGDEGITRKVQWDLDYIAQTNEWNLKQPDISEDEQEILDETAGSGTGTLVVWERVDRLLTSKYKNAKNARKALKRFEDQLFFHISMVYQRFLDREDVRAANICITLNDRPVKPWDPFCLKENNTEVLYDKTLKLKMEGEEKQDYSLKIMAVMIPRREEFSSVEAKDDARVSTDMQGFYVYRENRLIHFGDWMGMFLKEPHASLLRVEMSFDNTLDDIFNVDIKKSRILLNEDLFNTIQKQILPAPRRAAIERYRKGVDKTIEKSSSGTHDASNRSIDEKAPDLEDSRIDVVNSDTGDVRITNSNGTTNHRIVIVHPDESDECRVIPNGDIEDGILWKPALADGKHAVLINTKHPYYQKVYYPVRDQSVLITGMDSLLWALSEAENSTINEKVKRQYEDMRFRVSMYLRELVEDLPDPEMDN